MAKLHIYLLALIVWIILFNFAGLVGGTTGYLLKNLGITNPENFGSTAFYLTLLGITGITLVGIFVGGAVFQDAQLVLLVQVTLIGVALFAIGFDLILLFNELIRSNSSFAVLVIAPLLVLYALTVVEWIRGMST